MRSILGAVLLMLAGFVLPARERPGLLFREDWKELPAATPVTEEHVANPALTLHRYGPGRDEIKKSHHDQPKDDPYYIWSGECKGNWAVALRHKDFLADLTGAAKIRWRARQSGARQLRVIIKLADGTWLVSDQSDGPSDTWREREFKIAGIRWRALDINAVAEGAWVEKPDVRWVDEIGFTDLMAGGRTPASSRLDWIEVWAAARKRENLKHSSLVYPGKDGKLVYTADERGNRIPDFSHGGGEGCRSPPFSWNGRRMTETDLRHLRAVIEVARRAREHGNHPFGALLVDEHDVVLLEAGNNQLTARDCTGHAETNLLREASRLFESEKLARCTIYASAEPCAMCAGAIFWSGVGRVVFALGSQRLCAMMGNTPDQLHLSCGDVLAHGRRPVEVVGPIIEDEAQAVFEFER